MYQKWVNKVLGCCFSHKSHLDVIVAVFIVIA